MSLLSNSKRIARPKCWGQESQFYMNVLFSQAARGKLCQQSRPQAEAKRIPLGKSRSHFLICRKESRFGGPYN